MLVISIYVFSDVFHGTLVALFCHYAAFGTDSLDFTWFIQLRVRREVVIIVWKHLGFSFEMVVCKGINDFLILNLVKERRIRSYDMWPEFFLWNEKISLFFRKYLFFLTDRLLFYNFLLIFIKRHVHTYDLVNSLIIFMRHLTVILLLLWATTNLLSKLHSLVYILTYNPFFEHILLLSSFLFHHLCSLFIDILIIVQTDIDVIIMDSMLDFALIIWPDCITLFRLFCIFILLINLLNLWNYCWFSISC